MNVQQPNQTDNILVVQQYTEVQCHPLTPVRQLLIGQQENRTVAYFGYFDADDQWRCTFIPPEFREADNLAQIKDDLLACFGAVLMTVLGDTINHPPSRPG